MDGGAREARHGVDGVDDNCNGLVNDRDMDGDGYSGCTNDCNDSDPSIHPGPVETCGNGIDDNCNGFIDDVDGDHDGFFCLNDCNDNDPGMNPMEQEICGDSKDNNCNGVVDDVDNDGDGVLCYQDCFPFNSAAWRQAGEARSVAVGKSGSAAVLTWLAPADPGGVTGGGYPYSWYDAIAASTPSGFPGTTSCVGTHLSSIGASDPVVPALGTARYYLVRAGNLCGGGKLGTRSDGTLRTAPSCP